MRFPLSVVVRQGRCRRSSASTPYSSLAAGVRAGAALPRLIGFECESLAVELQIIDEAEGRLIVGQLLPARAGVVYVRHNHGDTIAEADDHGRFQAEHIPRGPLGLRIDVRVGDGSATVIDGLDRPLTEAALAAVELATSDPRRARIDARAVCDAARPIPRRAHRRARRSGWPRRS